MEPSSEPTEPKPAASQPRQEPGAMDIEIRAAFLEAFARELTKDTPPVDGAFGDLVDAGDELSLGGPIPVNRLAGLR